MRVEADRPAIAPVPNEVRVMTDGKMRNYIKYATTLLLVRPYNTAPNQGLTLAHFSAQLERFVWDRGCA